MPYPGSIDALETDVLVQDTDGTHSETFNVPSSSPYTHRLGAALSPALPSGWQIVPKGAFPIGTPGAPSGGTLIAGDSLLGLVSNGVYQWAVSNVTSYGETPPGTAYAPGAIGVGTGYQITMPANAQGTTDAPVISRKLWRTKNGGSTLYFVRDVDLDETTVIDGKPDDQLIITAPGSNTSGVIGTVTATGSSQTWTEQAPGTSLSAGGFIVDYGTTLTGGTVTFAAADAGKSVTLTWTGALLVNEAFVLALVQALKDLRTLLGAGANVASGVVVTDASTHITTVPEYILAGTGDKFTNSNSSSALLPGMYLTDGGAHTSVYGLTGATVAGTLTAQALTATGETGAPPLQLSPAAAATGANSFAAWLSNPNFGGGFRWDIGQLSNGFFGLAKDSGGAQTLMLELDTSGNVTVAGAITLTGGVSGTLAVAGNVTATGTSTFGSISANTQIATTLGGGLHITGTSALDGAVTIGGHEIHAETSAAPTIANGAQNTGSGGAASLDSSYPEDDTHGVISITIGATAVAGELAKVTFKNAYGTKPVVVVSPVGANLGLQLYTTPDAASSGKNGFSILSDN